MLENVPENKENLKFLLENILKIKIKKIEFVGIELFESIIEYDFSLLKIIVVDDKEYKNEIYLKMTRDGKIKETIFCYWSWLYENYYKNSEEKTDNMPKKVVISQKFGKESGNEILLTLNSEKDYCAEIHLVKLRKNIKNNIKLERWLNKLEIKMEDILFIGIKKY